MWTSVNTRVVRCKRSEMRHVLNLICTVFILHCICSVSSLGFHNATDSFIERSRMECTLQKDFASCGKYKLITWLRDIQEKEFSYGPLRIIRIPSMPDQSIFSKLPRSRAFRSSVMETLNFVRDVVEDFLTKRVVVYTIENPSSARNFGRGTMVLDDDEFEEMQRQQQPQGDWRIFKKKKSLIIPLLILLNLIKVKLLLLPIFLGVHFIKKALVLAGLVVPSLLAHLKICKVPPQQTYPYQAWATAAEGTVDYPTGYGQDDTNWIHRNDAPGHVVYPVYHAYRNPYG